MHLGFTNNNTPEDPDPAELARALEERGYESWWVGEHSHIPASRDTPYPAGGEMPAIYTRMMDPFISLTIAARATERLRIATGVTLALEHDVFQLAKSVATLDQLSGGRFLFGVGVGWNVEELADHRPDIAWAQRYRATGEAVGALRALWTDDEATFDGEFFSFRRALAFPKPAQSPHPPVIVGAAGPVGIRHTIEWGDAWAPVDLAIGKVDRAVARFRDLAAEAGRDLPITMVAWGDPPADRLRAYRELGIERVVLGAGRDGWQQPETTDEFLDRYAPLCAELA